MRVTIDDVRAARARIAGAVYQTPCVASALLSEAAGTRLVLKLENRQFTGSFKARGALNKLLSLSDDERQAGVIAASAGNHAQGVAYHAQSLGIAATLVMPRATPFIKLEQARHYGPRIVLEGDTLADSAAFAQTMAETEHLTFVHPYDDPLVVAGQGTIALEMLEDHPDIDTLVIPVGGGGLIAGIAVAAKGIKPAIEVIGVQNAQYPAFHNALGGRAGAPGGPTIAEGIAVADPGKTPLETARDLIAEVRLVSDGEIERAVLKLLEVEKTVVEGAGAAGLAAVLADPARFAGRNVGIVLTGGNIDARMLSSIILRGLAGEGRLVRLRIDIVDVPGNLAKVARIVGDAGANIVEVSHERYFSALPIKSAALLMVVETRNAAHADTLLAEITEAGFNARPLDLP